MAKAHRQRSHPVESKNLEFGMSKRVCKKLYLNGDIYLTEAVNCLMFEHEMIRGDAINYLTT